MSDPVISIVLIRHGNTFETGQVPVMIGSRENLPLTKAGEEQARALGRELEAAGLAPDAVYSSPLERAMRTAELAVSECAATPVRISEHLALKELDYGSWSGLSTTEIEQRFGRQVFEDWDLNSVQPQSAGFSPSSAEVIAGLSGLISDIVQAFVQPQNVLWLVSSNGILRYFSSIPGVKALPQSTGKMRTGSYSVLEYSEKELKVRSWDIRPGGS